MEESTKIILISIMFGIIIILISVIYDYHKKYKKLEDYSIRENKKANENKELSSILLNERDNLQDSIKVYKLLTDLLLTQPLAYAYGLMRTNYSVKPDGKVITRVKISKESEKSKWADVEGKLYYPWSEDSFISRENLIEALGHKDTRKTIEYINRTHITLEGLKTIDNYNNNKSISKIIDRAKRLE